MGVDVLFLSVDAVAGGGVDCETQIQLVRSSSLSFSGSFYRPEQLCITLELFRNHPAGGQEDGVDNLSMPISSNGSPPYLSLEMDEVIHNLILLLCKINLRRSPSKNSLSGPLRISLVST